MGQLLFLSPHSDQGGKAELDKITLRFSSDRVNSPIANLSLEIDDVELDVPLAIVDDLYRLIPPGIEDISPELQIIVHRISKTGAPEDTDLRLLAAQMMADEFTQEVTDDSPVSLAGHRLKGHDLATQKRVDDSYFRLDAYRKSESCPPVLCEVISKLLECVGERTDLDEFQSQFRSQLNAVLQFGTEAYTDPSQHCLIADVVLAYRDAFTEVCGIAEGTIYHFADLRALFSLEDIRIHENAKLVLVVPEDSSSETGEAKAILLDVLMVGGHLNVDLTSSFLDQKLIDAELLDKSNGLRQITISARELVQCGLSADCIIHI